LARKAPAIPPLLLEGDHPAAPKVSGPGARYALTPEALKSSADSLELPASYGTGQLFLTARDPHWLYAAWDLDSAQQARLNARSRDGRLSLRVFLGDSAKPSLPEVVVHRDSRDWFVNVPQAETRYRAELGYFDAGGTWIGVAQSLSTITPPDAPSADLAAQFATIPAEISFQQIVESVRDFLPESRPLLEAVAEASAETARAAVPDLPHALPPSPSRGGRAAEPLKQARVAAPIPIRIRPGKPWSAAQTETLARLIHVDSYRRVWMGSIEITELVRRQLSEEIASIAAAALAAGPEQPGWASDMASPLGGMPRRARKFWFKVNAELVIYGSTEPDAKVTIAERAVKLRPDGSFSFRFSLPDGRYQLPAVAIAADGGEGREARLEFSRSTDYRGEVGPHPQDAALRPPRPESLGR